MGHSTYSASEMMSRRKKIKEEKGDDVFTYTKRASRSGGGIALPLDPAFGGFRYANDPVSGEETEPFTLVLDVTGSNREAAKKVWEDLPQFFSLLNTHSWVPNHLQVQLGFVGDATCDSYPLQLSQFEGGSDIDKWLNLAILEGGGGGSKQESYQNAMWALNNQNKLASWERGKKGALIFVFDEQFYPYVSPSELQKMYARRDPSDLGDVKDIQISEGMKKHTLDVLNLPSTQIPTGEVIEELKQKYHVWGVICKESGYYGDATIMNPWRDAFGEQNIMSLPSANDISELCATILAAHYGANPSDILSEFKPLVSAETLFYLEEAAEKVYDLAPVNTNITTRSENAESDAGYL